MKKQEYIRRGKYRLVEYNIFAKEQRYGGLYLIPNHIFEIQKKVFGLFWVTKHKHTCLQYSNVVKEELNKVLEMFNIIVDKNG